MLSTSPHAASFGPQKSKEAICVIHAIQVLVPLKCLMADSSGINFTRPSFVHLKGTFVGVDRFASMSTVSHTIKSADFTGSGSSLHCSLQRHTPKQTF